MKIYKLILSSLILLSFNAFSEGKTKKRPNVIGPKGKLSHSKCQKAEDMSKSHLIQLIQVNIARVLSELYESDNKKCGDIHIVKRLKLIGITSEVGFEKYYKNLSSCFKVALSYLDDNKEYAVAAKELRKFMKKMENSFKEAGSAKACYSDALEFDKANNKATLEAADRLYNGQKKRKGGITFTDEDFENLGK